MSWFTGLLISNILITWYTESKSKIYLTTNVVAFET